MFGHLKTEEFINRMEREVHSEMSSMDAEILEPDWAEFRSSVRDQLLSRSIQRESAVRRWTGWAIRPALAWALSLVLAVGIPTGALLWHLRSDRAGAPFTENSQPLPTTELIDVGTDKAVFDDLIQLSDSEQQQLQQMIESAQKESPQLQ